MNIAVMVAAGRGTRMGVQTDKLFLQIAGRTVLEHSWRCLDRAPTVDRVRLVIREESIREIQLIAVHGQFAKPYDLVIGGAERQDSVWNGIRDLGNDVEVVAIHDAARPCVSVDLIERTLAAARVHGAAVAAQRMIDTVKTSENGEVIDGHLDRSKLWSVQTPQAFRLEVLLRAMERLISTGTKVTDDTAACELIGHPVKLVESFVPNPKVTLPTDLPYIETLLR